jgi:hypothetical protein
MAHPRSDSPQIGDSALLAKDAPSILSNLALSDHTDSARAKGLIANDPAAGHGSSLFAPGIAADPASNHPAIPPHDIESSGIGNSSFADLETVLSSGLAPPAYANSHLLDLTAADMRGLARLCALGRSTDPNPEQSATLARILGSDWPVPVKTDIIAAVIRVNDGTPVLSQRRLDFFAEPGFFDGYPPALVSHVAKTAVVKNWKTAMAEYDFFSKFRNEPAEIFATICERYTAFQTRLAEILLSTLGDGAAVSTRLKRALFALELAFGNTQSATITLALVNNPSLNHPKIKRDERISLFEEILSAADAYLHGQYADAPNLAASARGDAFLSRWFNPSEAGKRTITLDGRHLVVLSASLVRASIDSTTGEVSPISGRVKEFRLQTEMSTNPAFPNFTAFPSGFPRTITLNSGAKAVIDPDGWYKKSLPDGSTAPCLVEIKSLRGHSGQSIVNHPSLRQEGEISLQFLKYTAALRMNPDLRFHLRLVTDMTPMSSVKTHLQNVLENSGYSRAEAKALIARITVDVTPYRSEKTLSF